MFHHKSNQISFEMLKKVKPDKRRKKKDKSSRRVKQRGLIRGGEKVMKMYFTIFEIKS